MDERIYNFSPGPAMLPDAVLEEIQANLGSLNNSGIGPMELGHRTQAYMQLSDETHTLMRTILNVPENYQIISMHGGARTQFAAIPMNLASQTKAAYYIISGLWSEKAFAEAALSIEPHLLRELVDYKWRHVELDDYDASYVHYTPNETVHGIFIQPPATDLPIIADATSTLLGTKLDISKHALVYAAAQKNMGIAGITFVIIRDDLLANTPMPTTPSIMRYQNQVASNSLYNTPTTFALYVTNLMLKWVQNQGGLSLIAARNHNRSQELYELLEQHPHVYSNLVPTKFRSPLNVTFNLKNPSKIPDFLAQANANGLAALKGHKAVGGLRASIYNGMPNAGVHKLMEFLDDYARKNPE